MSSFGDAFGLGMLFGAIITVFFCHAFLGCKKDKEKDNVPETNGETP